MVFCKWQCRRVLSYWHLFMLSRPYISFSYASPNDASRPLFGNFCSVAPEQREREERGTHTKKLFLFPRPNDDDDEARAKERERENNKEHLLESENWPRRRLQREREVFRLLLSPSLRVCAIQKSLKRRGALNGGDRCTSVL